MKRISGIFIILSTILTGDSLDTDVNHVIVDHKGNSIVAIIDSMDLDAIYYKLKDQMDPQTIDIDKAYFIYNDFDRIYHYDWSYYENIRRIKNRTGKMITIHNDTIDFKNIEFTGNQIFPEILVASTNDTSFYMPMLDIYKIQTDYSIMQYAAERGFWYSFNSFILSAGLDTRLKWDVDRRFSPQVWDQYNDLLPAIRFLGANRSGPTYESVSYLIPISVLGSMLWDIWKDKRSFYFHPIEKDEPYPRNMYVFSLKHITEAFIVKTFRRIERTKIGGILFGRIRNKYF